MRKRIDSDPANVAARERKEGREGKPKAFLNYINDVPKTPKKRKLKVKVKTIKKVIKKVVKKVVKGRKK